MFSEKGHPVVGRHYHFAVLCANQLCHIYICRCIDNINFVLETADESSPEPLLEQAKAPVRRELRVPNEHECDRVIDSWRPDNTLHVQYWRKVLFLFCPAQLFTCRCKRVSPKAWCVRKWCTRLTTAFAPLQVSDAS